MATPLTHEYLLGAYDALCEDIIRWVPDVDRRLISRDQTLLRRHLETRGLRYFTIDLPEACKAFERCLADGSLVPITVPGFGMARHHGRKDLRPRLFWALWSRVFSFDGTLRKSPCSTSIAFLRQLMRLFAKYKEDCADAYKYASVRDFFVVEEMLPESSLDWEDPFAAHSHSTSISLDDFSPSTEYLGWALERDRGWNGYRTRSQHYQQVLDLLVACLPLFDITTLRGRHGPGAVSDGRGTRSKYEFPIWPEKLEAIFPFDWFGSSRLLFEDSYPSNGIAFSKLICVPKSAKGPRLIASEPICNQWIQQALAAWFLDAFRSGNISGSINIKDQTVSQEYARRASDGSGATIDLKSASDRLTCRLVERVFRKRPDLLSAMMACRTPLLRQDIDLSCPKWIELKKFATQGSALTFPVQSFVFYSLCMAAILWEKGERPSIESIRRRKREVVVYGDDLIVPSSTYRELVDALHHLGLKVNEHKSFGTGKFRESCGSDWYDGCDVTPHYITSDFDPVHPTSLASVLEASNNFFRGGYWVLADYLAKRVPYQYLSRIPIENGSVAIKGLFSYCGVKVSHLRARYNDSLMRTEYLIYGVTSKVTGTKPDGIERLRQWFTEEPAPTIKWDPTSYSRSIPSIKKRYAALY